MVYYVYFNQYWSAPDLILLVPGPRLQLGAIALDISTLHDTPI